MWIRNAVRNWRRRRRADAELDEEVRGYAELLADQKMRNGVGAAQARREAAMELGGVEQVKERTREIRTGRFLETLWQDVRYGARMLRKSPGFTIVAVLTLALGIGANTAIFSVIDGVLLSPLPYSQSQQLVAERHNESLMDIIDIQRQTRAFASGGGININPMDYTGRTEPVQLHVGLVDAGFLETLGVPPMLGRIITPQEDVQGGPRVAVASYSFWQNYLGGDTHALGKTIVLNGNPYTVIGVMPRKFVPPNEHADVFVSLWVGYPEAAPYRGVHFMHAYWRLKPGVTVAQAEADTAQIDRQLAEQYPSEEKGRKTELVPLHQWLVRNVETALLVLFGAVGLVLLIACTNFAGLLMARAAARHQELVIRAALGAGRLRLIRQALTESILLSLIGGAAGLLLAKWGTSALLSLKPAELERFSGIQMDNHVLLFVMGISILTGAVFGLAPAWSAARAEVADTLKESGRGSTAALGGRRLRQILVISELGVALVLLIGAGLLIKGFYRLRAVNPGFNPENVITMNLQLPPTRYAKIPKQTQFRRGLLARLNSSPGVQAAMVTDIPLSGNYVSHSIVIDGRPPVAAGDAPEVQTLSVMGDYLRVMQIPIRAGRDFNAMDREGQPLVAIVNEEMVREHFPHQNPIGTRIDWANRSGPAKWMTIVGVAADVKHSGLNQPTDPAVYAPFAQSDEAWRRWMTIAIRTPNGSPGLIEEAKKSVWSLDSQIPINDIHTMDELLSASLAEQRFDMLLLGLFAALALILALVGTYGVMAYVVSQRTHEIGIRMALGAQRTDVMRLVVGQGARLALAGIVIGIVGAFALTRLMASLLFSVRPTDPATFLCVAIALGAVAVAACYVPARRAMKVDPMVALRHE